MSFAKGDIVSLKGKPMDLFVVFEVLGDDLVSVKCFGWRNGQVLPIEALKHTATMSKPRRTLY